MERFKNLRVYQIAALLMGTLVAWTTVVKEFLKFYEFEGTIFKIHDCTVPNPITTPCFWGATAFLIALIWAICAFRLKNKKKELLNQIRLSWLLTASTIFGWGNVSYDFYKFFKVKMQPIQTCSGLVKNPFLTACFWGSVLFAASLVITLLIIRKSRKK